MKPKKKTRFQIAQDGVQKALNKTNERIEILGINTSDLYVVLEDIQNLFDKIRNVPSKHKLQYEELKKVHLNWKQQAEKIENDYKTAIKKNAGAGIAGAGAGIAIAAMGPTAAMGLATTFGVASTGTAISALSGAAATNAALAWLGGGALAAGGGGMAAGGAFLALAGPLGWTIAGVTVLTSALISFKSRGNKKCLEEVFTLISERDIKSYNLAIVEINERITRIVSERQKLNSAINKIQTFGLDYDKMTEAQQYELGAYVNLMLSSTQLLVNPIMGLQPKYSENDYQKYVSWNKKKGKSTLNDNCKMIIISLANFLYSITLNDKSRKLLWKSFRSNKDMLKSVNISKKEFGIDIMDTVDDALKYQYIYLDITQN